MNSKPQPPASRGLTWGAWVVFWTIAAVGAVAWLLIRTPDLKGWPALLVVLLAVLLMLHGSHETRRIRRAVAEALRGRPRLTDEEFGGRFPDPRFAPVAIRLRRLLAEHLECELAGMVPADNFEQWLQLSSGPDSAADTFFEELAIEFRLRRDCPWPRRFDSFATLVRLVCANTPTCTTDTNRPSSAVAPAGPSDMATEPLKKSITGNSTAGGTKPV